MPKQKVSVSGVLKSVNAIGERLAKLEAENAELRSKLGLKKKPGRPKKVTTADSATPKRKPGRPRKNPVEVPATPKRKPGRPKNAAKAAPAAPKGPKGTRGRKPRADGKPKLKDGIRMVMGRSTMNAGEILEGLKAKSWMPESNNPQQYISTILSSNSDMFERIQNRRGYYKVKAGNVVSSDNGGAKAAPVAPPAQEETAEDLAQTTNDLLNDLPDDLPVS